MTQLVGLNPRESHRHSAPLAKRMLNFDCIVNVVRFLHRESRFWSFCRRKRYGLSVTGACEAEALVGDMQKL